MKRVWIAISIFICSVVLFVFGIINMSAAFEEFYSIFPDDSTVHYLFREANVMMVISMILFIIAILTIIPEREKYIDREKLKNNEDISWKERAKRIHKTLYFGSLIIENNEIVDGEDRIVLVDVANLETDREKIYFSYQEKEYTIVCLNREESDEFVTYIETLKAEKLGISDDIIEK